MDTGHSNHSDVHNVVLMDAQIGAADGDEDASLWWAKAGGDLGGYSVEVRRVFDERRDLKWIYTDFLQELNIKYVWLSIRIGLECAGIMYKVVCKTVMLANTHTYNFNIQ